MRTLIMGLFLALGAVSALAQETETPPPDAPPGWFVEHVEYMTRGGGRWLAGNADYPDDGWQAYAQEWMAGPGNYSMTGRLFGMKDGAESDGDFWQFSVWWDPDGRAAMITQSGWGAVGTGEIWTEGGGDVLMRQTFHAFDGGRTDQGHRAAHPDANTHITQSFDIVDGKWRPKRRYEWVRQSAE